MIVLASQSPRRKELLSRIVPEFHTEPSGFDETSIQDKIPERLVRKLAEGKAKEVQSRFLTDTIIGCDTIVVSPDNQIYGIPKDKEEAFFMISSLSGRTHRVITGVCVLKGTKKSVFHKTTKVTFSQLTDNDIATYLELDEAYDKAGAYGIQGYAGSFVEKINGDYYNVVGLPIATLRKVLKLF